jgi:hypothetical protein
MANDTDCDASSADDRLLIDGRLYVRTDLSGLDFMVFRSLQLVRPHVVRKLLERDDRRDQALKLISTDVAARIRARGWVALIPWVDPRGSFAGQWEPPMLPMDLPFARRRL